MGKLIREGDKRIKTNIESLLHGEIIRCSLDEQIVYNQLGKREGAIWSLLLASGYLKVIKNEEKRIAGKKVMYDLALTNMEVADMFYDMVSGWFEEAGGNYNDFVEALLMGDLDAMNDYMELVAEDIFSSFDS